MLYTCIVTGWTLSLCVIYMYCYRMATDEEEVVLCTIQMDASGVVSMHPDFNRGRKAYIKESQKDFGRGKKCFIF